MVGEIFANLYHISSIDGLKRNYTNKVGFTDEHFSNSPYNLNRLITAYLNINYIRNKIDSQMDKINPFPADNPILYPLKTPESPWFSGVFKGYKMGALAKNGLRGMLILL